MPSKRALLLSLFLLLIILPLTIAASKRPTQTISRGATSQAASSNPPPGPTVTPAPPGPGDGEGSVSPLETAPPEIKVRTSASFKFSFIVGPQGIKPNGSIIFFLPFQESAAIQTSDPNAPNFFGAYRGDTQSGSRLVVDKYNELRNNLDCANRCLCVRTQDGRQNPYWITVLKIKVPDGGLDPEERLTIVWGWPPSPGALMNQRSQYEIINSKDQSLRFYVAVDGDGDCHASYLPAYTSVRIFPQPANHLELVLPSLVGTNDSIKLIVKAKDQLGNLAISYRGTVAFTNNNPEISLNNLPPTYTFNEADAGIHIFNNVIPTQSGLVRITGQGSDLANDPYTPDGLYESNPMIVENQAGNKIFWGDIHTHSLESDGQYSLDKLYNDAKNNASLDFAASSNHAGMLTSGEWQSIRDAANFFHQPPDFVTLVGYEISCATDQGGQNNFYFLSDNGPVFYCRHWAFSGINGYETLYGTEIQDFGQIFSRSDIPPAILIPHHVTWKGRGQNWEYFHQDLEKIVEIYSEHGSGEYYNNPLHHVQEDPQSPLTAQAGLAKGYRFGFIGGSDDHYESIPGGLSPRPPSDLQSCLAGKAGSLCYKGGLAAVYGSTLSRDSLFSSLRSRHTYATSGERIFVSFSAEVNNQKYLMGDEISATTSPIFSGKVAGTNTLRKVEIIKGIVGDYDPLHPFPTAFNAPVNAKESEFSWQDPDFNQSAFYYLRVTQEPSRYFSEAPADMAWSSPIWVDKTFSNFTGCVVGESKMQICQSETYQCTSQPCQAGAACNCRAGSPEGYQ